MTEYVTVVYKLCLCDCDKSVTYLIKYKSKIFTRCYMLVSTWKISSIFLFLFFKFESGFWKYDSFVYIFFPIIIVRLAHTEISVHATIKKLDYHMGLKTLNTITSHIRLITNKVKHWIWVISIRAFWKANGLIIEGTNADT